MYLSQYKKEMAYCVGIDGSMTGTGAYFASMHPEMQDFHYEVGSTAKAGRDLPRQFEIVDTIIEDLDALDGKIALVAFEDYGPINKFSGKLTQRAEIIGILKRHVIRNVRCKMVTIGPKPLKKFATGNGNAKKDAMMQSAAQLYGFMAATDNEADACHLAHLGYRIHAGLKATVDYQLYMPD